MEERKNSSKVCQICQYERKYYKRNTFALIHIITMFENLKNLVTPVTSQSPVIWGFFEDTVYLTLRYL